MYVNLHISNTLLDFFENYPYAYIFTFLVHSLNWFLVMEDAHLALLHVAKYPKLSSFCILYPTSLT